MATYRIDVTKGTNTGTVVPDVSWRYTKQLNQVNEAELKFSATGETNRALLKIGATVTIYKNGTIDFIGLIDNTDYFVGGTVVFHASGYEVWLAKENGAYTNSPWTSTASATIFAAIITESSYLSAGTINTGFDTDYRLSTSQSLFNAISNLANKTTQDISIDYTASPIEISVLDHVGSATSVMVLNEGKEITNLRRSEGYPRGNSIKVFGKGDGDNQITGSDSDATSIAEYGTITKIVTDRSVMTTAEANKLATAELALNKDPPNIYDFDLTNPEMTGFVLGDVITLNALDQDVINTDVRIVGIEEGENKSQAYITLQTTNPELKTLMRTKNKIMAQIKKDQTDDNTYMQGNTVTNEWGTGINADSSHAAKVGFYVPPEFDTEAGSLDTIWMKVDYDIDPYNSQFGTASFTGTDPQVQNSSGDESALITGLSGEDSPLVTGTSSSQLLTSNQGSDTFSENVATTWDLVLDEAIDGSFSFLYVDLEIEEDSWSGTDTIGIRIRVASTVYVQDIQLSFITTQSPFKKTYAIPFFGTSTGTVDVAMYSVGNQDYQGSMTVYGTDETHTHGDGNYAAVDHDHDDGNYATVDHDHPPGGYDINAADLSYISIGDAVSDAASVNATGATIYLDFWNTGTSAWDNKHSRVFGSDTLKTNVDMTDSGTYPDADGYWRIRVIPNSATSDFVNAKVRLKFKIDN